MSDKLRVLARGKVNLSFQIKGKRADGFHEVDTVMTPVEGLADELTFTPAEKGAGFSLSCGAKGVPTDETNLVTRAVREFEKELGRSVDYECELLKKIPHGAGLGGGSGDAAAALLALNELEAGDFSLDELAKMAGRLGSDVPFFLYEATCRCTGRGEVVEPLPDFERTERILLLKPDFGIATPDAYGRWVGADSGEQELPGVRYTPQLFSWGALYNDLEKPVFAKYLVLAEMKMWLLQQAGVKGALMSGSGSTVLALIDEEVEMEEVYQIMQNARATFGKSLWTFYEKSLALSL